MTHYKKLDNGKKEKTCSKCKKVFTVDELKELSKYFYKRKTLKDGFGCYCKICFKKINAKSKKKNWMGILLGSAQARAKKYNRPFDDDLTVEWGLKRFKAIGGKCENPECGKKLKTGGGRGKHDLDSATLDRFNNEGGYTKGNVQFLCYYCNCSKNSGQLPYERKILNEKEKQEWLDGLGSKIEDVVKSINVEFKDPLVREIMSEKDVEAIKKVYARACKRYLLNHS